MPATKVFEALKPVSASDKPAKCPTCGRDADRIMPTTFQSMARHKGLRERVPYHQKQVRGEEPKPTIARVKPKTAASRSSGGKKTTKKG